MTLSLNGSPLTVFVADFGRISPALISIRPRVNYIVILILGGIPMLIGVNTMININRTVSVKHNLIINPWDHICLFMGRQLP